jgi:hypothetical protein
MVGLMMRYQNCNCQISNICTVKCIEQLSNITFSAHTLHVTMTTAHHIEHIPVHYWWIKQQSAEKFLYSDFVPDRRHYQCCILNVAKRWHLYKLVCWHMAILHWKWTKPLWQAATTNTTVLCIYTTEAKARVAINILICSLCLWETSKQNMYWVQHLHQNITGEMSQKVLLCTHYCLLLNSHLVYCCVHIFNTLIWLVIAGKGEVSIL